MGHANRKSPGRPWGFGLEQQEKRGSRGEGTRLCHEHMDSEGPMGHPRKVASGQEGPELRYTTGNQHHEVLNYLSPGGCSGRMGRVKRVS